MIFYLSIGIGFVFGSCLGSFLAAWRDRMRRGLSIVDPPRSHCPFCRRELAGWENIPIVSYAVLRGKSRCCQNKIPAWYFFYELLWGLGGGAVGVLVYFLL